MSVTFDANVYWGLYDVIDRGRESRCRVDPWYVSVVMKNTYIGLERDVKPAYELYAYR